MIKIKPEEIRQEYEKGKSYNANLDLYDEVEKNQRFYAGDQWYGVKAPGMMKPVFNIIKRVTNYLVSMIVSNDISASINPFDEANADHKALAKVISTELEKQMERNHLKEISRELAHDACVDGESYIYSYFDADAETFQTVTGAIASELIENTKVVFGNPYSEKIQSQPYIIIVQRMYVEQVKEEARKNGLSDSDINLIKADNDVKVTNDDSSCLATVLTKFWKEEAVDKDGNKAEKKTIHFVKVCGDVTIKEKTNTGCALYPLSKMVWEKRKNSYHGISPVSEIRENQIFINKTFAMAMIYMQANGFPRILYDSNKIKSLASGAEGSYKVQNIDLLGKIIEGIKVPDFSSQMMPMIQNVFDMTKEFMGASDASLGNVNPDNTSAIIAVQQATAIPLEIQKLAFKDCIEATVRIYIDLMAEYFGTRLVKYTDDMGTPYYENINFKILKSMNFDLNVEVGDSAYWSEINQVNTLDNLFNKGIITDAVTYLENVPDKYIKGKQKLIDSVKNTIQEQNDLAMQQEATRQAAELIK